MSLAHFGILVVTGVGAGLAGSVAGLASLISYPVLLALGLSPLSANVSNTWGLLATGAGSAVGARRELAGQGRRVAILAGWAGIGGGVGAGLLVIGSSATFKQVVPWLVAFGALLLLARDALRGWLARRARPGPAQLGRVTRLRNLLPVILVGVYGGYFGAGAGIMFLALLSVQTREPLAITNAVKNVGGTAANATAAVIFAFVAPVNWPAAAALSIGTFIGSWCGPAVVRVVPERPLRLTIVALGLGLAVALFLGWPR